jgi:hypothetical protein
MGVDNFNYLCAKLPHTRIRLALNSHSKSLPRSIPAREGRTLERRKARAMYRVLPKVGIVQAATAPATTAPGTYCISPPRFPAC